MTEQSILTPIEAINEFYRLKDKYESEYYKKYIKPIVSSQKSKREKRVEYSRLPKHECINCKRNVGTIWEIKKIENIKKFIAKCGDIQDPCPLDIEINYSIREVISKEIRYGIHQIEKHKLNIIKEKNNSLFFNKNVVGTFEKLTENLKLETENTGFLIETNILRNDNPEKYLLLKQTIDEFGKGFIIPFKEMVKQFDETNNELILNQAITFYINEMLPKLKEILSLKYDVNMVEYDDLQKIYKLIQLPNSIESNEFFDSNDDKVVKFIRGIRKATKKTRKIDLDSNKKKTRKIKPIAELVLEDEEDEIINEEIGERLENKYHNSMMDLENIKPIFDESGNISWNNEEYNNTWKRMPAQLKTLLLEDKDWLEDFVNSCVKLRREGKPCELFLPKQTKFPPNVTSEGKYDFDSEIVNKIFNSLSKQYQENLLSVYSIKNGEKNYNLLKDTLSSILAKKINFDRGYF